MLVLAALLPKRPPPVDVDVVFWVFWLLPKRPPPRGWLLDEPKRPPPEVLVEDDPKRLDVEAMGVDPADLENIDRLRGLGSGGGGSERAMEMRALVETRFRHRQYRTLWDDKLYRLLLCDIGMG